MLFVTSFYDDLNLVNLDFGINNINLNLHLSENQFLVNRFSFINQLLTNLLSENTDLFTPVTQIYSSDYVFTNVYYKNSNPFHFYTYSSFWSFNITTDLLVNIDTYLTYLPENGKLALNLPNFFTEACLYKTDTSDFYSYKDSASYKNFSAVDDYFDKLEGFDGKDSQAIIDLKRRIADIKHTVSLGSDELLLNPINDRVYSVTGLNAPVDTSNLYNLNGNLIDIKQLEDSEILKLRLTLDNDDLYNLERLEHVRSVVYASTPTSKCFYPEPFIASPTYIHSDLTFIHILQYQFWLWFVFIFLIVFFFLTFLTVIRWSNLRTQPRRETRGVSRSKCGDLITACVPVSWAISIIVSESTDAMDYYDGFGTTEVIIGVRAYQWGWEYYYPKDLDLNYQLQPSYSQFIGNSVKYNNSTAKTLEKTNLWRFYQNLRNDDIVTPAHLLVLPVDNSEVLNFLNFDDIGHSALKESSAFKKIRTNSKLYNTNLENNTTSLNQNYGLINNLHTSENLLIDSLTYGNKRQHNLTSTAVLSNTSSTYLDKNSFNKLLEFNFNKSDLKNLNTASITQSDRKSLLTNEGLSNTSTALDKHLNFTNLISEINNDSDKTLLLNSVRKLLNDKIFSFEVLDFKNPNTLFNNKPRNLQPSQTVTTQSSNQGILPIDQSLRHYKSSEVRSSNFNLSKESNNLNSFLNRNLTGTTYSPLNKYFLNTSLSWNDTNSLNKLATARLYFELPYTPMLSNKSLSESKDFDNQYSIKSNSSSQANTLVKEYNLASEKDSNLFKGSRDGLPKPITSSYWHLFWGQSSTTMRLDPALNFSNKGTEFYFPEFTNYVDYDFRNSQALDLLEDAYWETSYTGYSYTDYLNLSKLVKTGEVLPSKLVKLRANFFKDNLGKGDTSSKVALKTNFYPSVIQTDTSLTQPNLVNTKDFTYLPILTNLNYLDESYSSYKDLLNFTTNTTKNLRILSLNNAAPQTYSLNLNSFRADFEDFSTFKDVIKNIQPIDLSDSSKYLLNTSESDNLNLTKISNTLVLRSSLKNSIVTYNALQKVFKSRFDEGRSHTSFSNFSSLKNKQPFISDKKVAYTGLLSKNKESYFNTNFYVTKNYNFYNLTPNPSNVHFFDFPFLTSQISDVARYLWMDWYSKWGMYEVQPSSVSKYSTLGVPYSKQHFDYTPDLGSELSDVETYFTRISLSRKNYLANWRYTPFLYTRMGVWDKSSIWDVSNNQNTDFIKTSYVLENMSYYWNDLVFNYKTTNVFTPSISGDTFYNRSSWRPYTGVQSYYYLNNQLLDILTRREYLYRDYYENNYNLVNLPVSLTASSKNPLINEIKSSFSLTDPISYSSEASRDVYYNSLEFFKFLLLKDAILNINKNIPVNLKGLTNYLFFYFSSKDFDGYKDSSAELFKSQHRPLRKGITNMLRLQSTGAVAMPIEIRLRILASSRDVIHSWSIPSAGIKIDCVPGYTSHKVMIFLVSGIYWGQCMEICGRYHHWMPIVVYFMKRDLFFLWCTHFVFKSGLDDVWEINDKAYTNYLRLASYDKTSWLEELTN